MLDWSDCTAVQRVPDKVSGAWVFRGTRVPVKALFKNLESGATIDPFLAANGRFDAFITTEQNLRHQ